MVGMDAVWPLTIFIGDRLLLRLYSDSMSFRCTVAVPNSAGLLLRRIEESFERKRTLITGC